MSVLNFVKRIIRMWKLLPSIYKYGGVTHVNISTINYQGKLFTSDDVVLITGGSSGIGYAIAKRFLEEGATVIISGRNKHKIDNAVHELSSERILGLIWDVSDVSIIDSKFEEIESLVKKKITILVNNAGMYSKSHFPNMLSEDWDDVYNTNLKGLSFITQCFINRLLNNPNDGKIKKIINISSQGGMVMANNAYRMTKWDIRGFTKYLGYEFASKGIISNAIAPGIILTDMQPNFKKQGDNFYTKENPIRRIGLPEEVAELAIFLASNAANFIVGETICCDGGYNIN